MQGSTSLVSDVEDEAPVLVGGVNSRGPVKTDAASLW